MSSDMVFVGISLESSTFNTVKNNTMRNVGMRFFGDNYTHWNSHTIDTSNLVNGKPIYYWRGKLSGTVPSGAGQIILADCKNIIVVNQNLSNCFAGIQVGFSEWNFIRNNNLSSNYQGIYLESSSNNTINGNRLVENSYGAYDNNGNNSGI